MFERFTERARHAVKLAQGEARDLGHRHIGTEHLLLGLVREECGMGGRVLTGLGVSLDATREEVVRRIGRGGDGPVTGNIPFTPRAKKALELALREALALGHNYIGTEHVLLGLVRGDGLADQILRGYAITPEDVRTAVVRFLTGQRRGKAEVAPSGPDRYVVLGARVSGETWLSLNVFDDEDRALEHAARCTAIGGEDHTAHKLGPALAPPEKEGAHEWVVMRPGEVLFTGLVSHAEALRLIREYGDRYGGELTPARVVPEDGDA